MGKTARADDRGRIVIPADVRERFGNRYRIVELHDRIELIPLAENPVRGLRTAVGDAFADVSAAEVRRVATEAAQRDARDGLKDPES